MELKIEYLNPEDLTPYAGNAKVHPPEQVEHIANSIKQFGWKQPIVVDADNVVIIGHGRLLAAKELGLDTVPCVRADDLTPEQADALRLADNKTNESDWNFSKLEEELAALEIAGFDMSDFGFEIDDKNTVSEIIEDEPPEPPETPVSKPGDIWQLGRHRLMCGDSTDAATVDRLMDGVKAKLLLTDPPYGISVVKTNKVGGDGALHFKGLVRGRVEGGGFVKAENTFRLLAMIQPIPQEQIMILL